MSLAQTNDPPLRGSDADRFSRKQQFACICLCLAAFAAAAALAHPLAMIGVAILPFVIVVAARSLDRPFELCLLFVIFSFFRIHEAFPALYPLRIPNALAIGTFAALGWTMVLRRAMEPFWTRELTFFSIFFVHVTIGLFFATDRPAAFGYWQATYSKIFVITISIAWLLRDETQFRKLMIAVVAAGIAVSGVTIYNKVNEIGLVEGTRVTIGRSFGSALGDPNDLSLVLLFPIAFATALAVTRGLSGFERAIGAIGVPVIAYAVVATQSRGGLLGFLAVWGVIANHYIRQKWILVVGGAVAGVALKLMAGISKRASGGAHEDGIDESAMGRIHAWEAAIRMATAHPFVGVGIDNFLQNYFFYTPHWDGMNHAVHSTWFVVIAEAGFLGFGVFLTLFVLTVRSALQALRALKDAGPAPRALSLALVAGLAGFAVSGTFLTQGFTWPFYIKLGLVVALAQYARRREQPEATCDGETQIKSRPPS
ncbi:MAG: O-antigen ligase family protein [Beijerinckiaceae bacterium]|jgi:probable O-glycosylation ligase (exosortase A-associated)